MRLVSALAFCLGLATPAMAQVPLGQVGGTALFGPEPRVKLDLSLDQARLITQTLSALGCQTVQQMIVCQQAAALLGEIKAQAVAQEKK